MPYAYRPERIKSRLERSQRELGDAWAGMYRNDVIGLRQALVRCWRRLNALRAVVDIALNEGKSGAYSAFVSYLPNDAMMNAKIAAWHAGYDAALRIIAPAGEVDDA